MKEIKKNKHEMLQSSLNCRGKFQSALTKTGDEEYYVYSSTEISVKLFSPHIENTSIRCF